MQCLFIMFFTNLSAEMILRDIAMLHNESASWKLLSLKLHLNCRNCAPSTAHNILKKKIVLALIIWSRHQFENALFVHPHVDLMAYFIASKCFAAKTGFPNRWLDVAQAGFSKCAFF